MYSFEIYENEFKNKKKKQGNVFVKLLIVTYCMWLAYFWENSVHTVHSKSLDTPMYFNMYFHKF